MKEGIGEEFRMEAWLSELLTADPATPAALATVVAQHGSTPREAGARMILFADGRQVGTIGGRVRRGGGAPGGLRRDGYRRPRLVTIDLAGFFGDELEVCGGRMEVFVEPVDLGFGK